MASTVVRISRSTRVGETELYHLKSDGSFTHGEQQKQGNTNIEQFLNSWRDRLQRIVDAKQDGFDQIRIASERTCQPIYDFEVHVNGQSRNFGVYAEPQHGAQLESGGTLPDEIADLYQLTKQ
jgi:hypothetical protein